MCCAWKLFLTCALVAVSFPAGAQSAEQKKSAKPHTSPHPRAIIETTAGNITCTLFPEKAPNGVANFIGLATGARDWVDPRSGQTVHGRPLYDGTICHRVQPGFMVQCGDPLGTGQGGPGYRFDNEIAPDLKFDVPGVLAYANSGLDENGHGTNGSQFFITEQAQSADEQAMLNGNYTIFGLCTTESVGVVKKIARRPVVEGTERPVDPVVINHIRIEGVTIVPSNPHKKK
jgi:peptidyl-prolyl cis-trans isomerase A (cyclophilin A)